MNIIIYSNCAGNVLTQMFERHPDIKCNIHYLTNYEKLASGVGIDIRELNMLKNADVFIYQPFNKNHDYSQWNVSNL